MYYLTKCRCCGHYHYSATPDAYCQGCEESNESLVNYLGYGKWGYRQKAIHPRNIWSDDPNWKVIKE